MAVYGFDDGNNKREVYTKEEVINIVRQAIENHSTAGIDPELVAIPPAIKEQNENVNARFWIGTAADFNALEISAIDYLTKVDENKNVYLVKDQALIDLLNNEATQAAALNQRFNDFSTRADEIEQLLNDNVAEPAFSVTIPANGWTGNAAPYTNVVNVTGVLATNNYTIIGFVPSETLADNIEVKNQLGQITYFTSANGTLTFVAGENKPTVNLPVMIRKEV